MTGATLKASWRKPWWRRITWRGLMLAATAVFLFAYPTYIYLFTLVTGGITHQGNLLKVDMQAMSNFEMDQDSGTTSDIPPRYRQLDGKRVVLTGQMYEPYVANGRIHRFTLCYSITNCCFNGLPKVQHFVQATVLPGKDVDYSPDLVDVIGTLHVGVQDAAGHVQSVYRMDVEAVKRD